MTLLEEKGSDQDREDYAGFVLEVATAAPGGEREAALDEIAGVLSATEPLR